MVAFVHFFHFPFKLEKRYYRVNTSCTVKIKSLMNVTVKGNKSELRGSSRITIALLRSISFGKK